MRIFRSVALGAALLTSSAWAFGQVYQTVQYGQNRAYRDGFEQGRADAQSGRGRHPNSNDREFRRGYDEGYDSGRGNRGSYGPVAGPYGGRPGNGGYGGGGGYGNMGQMARDAGFRDGRNDGAKDRATGHSFRPTQGDNYKNAPGYSSNMGDRQQYKDMYRQAYQQAYQQGYYGRR